MSYYSEHRLQRLAYQTEYNARNAERVREYQAAYRAQHGAVKRVRCAHKRTLRTRILDLLGRTCNCCAETIERFLTIDHVNNDGGVHRKIKGSNEEVYRDILKQGCPRDRFQILCFNCNLGKARNNGICPHKA